VKTKGKIERARVTREDKASIGEGGSHCNPWNS